MKLETVGTIRKLTILSGLLVAAAAQADEALPPGYVMTVYSDMAHGAKILKGSEGEAIAKLSGPKKLRAAYLADQINLCVAYTKDNQLDKAVVACDSAIQASDKEARRIKRSDLYGRASVRIADTGRAIALTNRGVLHAIAGEREQARMLFKTATELRSKETSAQHNLALLSHKTVLGES